MALAELRAQLEGQNMSTQVAELFPLNLLGYWADENGQKVSETFFGDDIYYYFKGGGNYNLTLNVIVSIESDEHLPNQEEVLLRNLIKVQSDNDKDVCVVKITVKDRWELAGNLKNERTAILKFSCNTLIYGISEHINEISISEFKLDNNIITSGPKLKSTTMLERSEFIQNVHAVILHRTGSNTVSSALNCASEKAAAHLYVDKNGDVYQKISFAQKAPHVGNIRVRPAQGENPKPSSAQSHNSEQKKDYPKRYPYNEDSIGIEVVGMYLSRKNKTPTQTTEYYTSPTDIEQIKSVARLVNFLTGYFTLNKDEDIYGHEVISSKCDGEGQAVHDVIIPYLL